MYYTYNNIIYYIYLNIYIYLFIYPFNVEINPTLRQGLPRHNCFFTALGFPAVRDLFRSSLGIAMSGRGLKSCWCRLNNSYASMTSGDIRIFLPSITEEKKKKLGW